MTHRKKKEQEILCVWCGRSWDDAMLEVEAEARRGCSTCGYGSSTYGTVTITCSGCNKIVYQKDFDTEK